MDSVNTDERNILTVTCFGHFMSHFNMLVFPSLVLPLTLLLKMDIGGVLALSFWMYLLFGVTALPWGLLADRMGAKPLLYLFFLGTGVCGIIAALNMDNATVLTWSLAGIGFFSGTYHPAGLGLIAKGVEKTSIGMAYNGIFGNLGLAFAPLASGLLLWMWGPAAAYWLLALLNLTGMGLLLLMPVNEPKVAGGQESMKTNGNLVPFLALLAAMMLGGIVYRGATVTLPAYFELNTPGVLAWVAGIWPGTPSANLVATLTISMIFVIGALGQYAGGKYGEKHDLRWGYIIFHSIALPALLLITFLQNLPLVIATTVYLFFLLGMQPIENTLVTRLSPPALKSTAFGTKFVLTFGVGALAVKMASGVQEAWGIQYVFTAMGLVTLLLLASIGVLIKLTQPMK